MTLVKSLIIFDICDCPRNLLYLC